MALSLVSMAAAAQNPAPEERAKPAVASIAGSAAQSCRAHPTVSVCDDALRWNPSDPSLLTAMGDVLMRVRRPADALRVYQRAAALAPDSPGIEAKVQAAQARSKPKKLVRDQSNSSASGKRFSNSDPDTQTH